MPELVGKGKGPSPGNAVAAPRTNPGDAGGALATTGDPGRSCAASRPDLRRASEAASPPGLAQRGRGGGARTPRVRSGAHPAPYRFERKLEKTKR
jgi:hypothetical protein